MTEFLPPVRPTKKQRVIIFLDGAPTVPHRHKTLEFFSKKGFWVFHPRYRGTWESDGKFLQHSPERDVLDVIDGLYGKFLGHTDINYNFHPSFKTAPDAIYIVGSSFGGPAAILASRDRRVTKAISFAPVIDWTKPGKDEPLDEFEKFTSYAFGQGYRTVKNGFAKLASGKFYNPVNHVAGINGSKLLLIHAKDDTTCPYRHTKKFATQTQAKLLTLPHGGHLGSSILLKPRFYKLFKQFINK